MSKPLTKYGIGCSLTVIKPGDTYKDPVKGDVIAYEDLSLKIDLVKNKNSMKFSKEQWNSIMFLYQQSDVQLLLASWQEEK